MADEELIEVRTKIPEKVAAVLKVRAETIGRYSGSRDKLIAEIILHWFEEEVHASRLTANLVKYNGEGKI